MAIALLLLLGVLCFVIYIMRKEPEEPKERLSIPNVVDIYYHPRMGKSRSWVIEITEMNLDDLCIQGFAVDIEKILTFRIDRIEKAVSFTSREDVTWMFRRIVEEWERTTGKKASEHEARIYNSDDDDDDELDD